MDAAEAHRMHAMLKMEEEMVRELEPSAALSRRAEPPQIPGERARLKRNEQKFLAIGHDGGKRDRAMANGGRLTVAERLERALEYAATHGGPHTPLGVKSGGASESSPELGRSGSSIDAVKSNVPDDFFRAPVARVSSLRDRL